MNQNAKKWVEALKSGNYSQSIDVLHDNYGYCCLGLSCKIYEQETGDSLPKFEEIARIIESEPEGLFNEVRK